MADLVGGGLMLGVDWFVVGCNGVVGWVPFWLLLVLCWLRLITGLFVVYSWFGLVLVVLDALLGGD